MNDNARPSSLLIQTVLKGFGHAKELQILLDRYEHRRCLLDFSRLLTISMFVRNVWSFLLLESTLESFNSAASLSTHSVFQTRSYSNERTIMIAVSFSMFWLLPFRTRTPQHLEAGTTGKKTCAGNNRQSHGRTSLNCCRGWIRKTRMTEAS